MSATLWTNAALFLGADVWIEHGFILQEKGLIKSVGEMHSCPEVDVSICQCHDLKGKLVTPLWIDCHTHLIYAGNRFDEHQSRLVGLSYAEISARGGGILRTVAETRQATFDQLYEAALTRVNQFKRQGVGAVEIKSGYGLDLASERKMLEVAKALEQASGLRVIKTFLGAHAVSP